MPIYEYQCQKCTRVIESYLVKTTDKPPVKCPECQGELKRLMSRGTGLSLQGSGWAKDNYGCKLTE